MSDALRGVVVCHGGLAEGAGRRGRVDQRRDRRAPAGLQHRLRPRGARATGRRGGGRAAVGGVRRPRLRLVPLRRAQAAARAARASRSSPASTSRCWWISSSTSRSTPRPPPSARSRPVPRRSGLPDGDRALPGGRPADPWTGGRGLGAPARGRAGSCWWTTRSPASDWEQDLYRMAVTPDIEVEFVTVRAGGGAAAGLAVRRAPDAGPHRRPRDHGRAPRRGSR